MCTTDVYTKVACTSTESYNIELACKHLQLNFNEFIIFKSKNIIQETMSAKTLGIIFAGFAGGVIVIALAMSAGSGWETPGSYKGVSNAAHAVTDQTNCYAFQTGCKNTGYSIGTSGDGQDLSGSSALTSTSGSSNSSSYSSSYNNPYSP